MRMSFSWLFTSLFLLMCVTAQSQIQLHIANNYFRQHRYPSAIRFYGEAIKRKPTLEATQKLADSYRFIKDYNRAEFWFSKAIAFPGSPSSNWLQYGLMLKMNEKYLLAKEIFTKYSAIPGVDITYANQLKNSCDSAIAWIQEPTYLKVVNQSEFNSVYSDYQVVKFGDSTYFFTSNRPTAQSRLGAMAKDQELPFYRLVNSSISTEGKIQSVTTNNWFPEFRQHIANPSFSRNQDTVFFTVSTFAKRNKEKLNRLSIYYSVKVNNTWTTPKSFPFNNDAYSVSHPHITPAGTELYFVSDVPGGFGGSDIYCSKLEGGIWSTPVNLGGIVNTASDEFLPTTHNDKLFFSSMGHIGLGGLDIFYATRNDAGWSNVTNVKPPFNSPQDDFGISFDPKNNKGFISSNRTGGLGYDDIYSFEYEETVPSEDFIEVWVTYNDNANLGEPLISLNSEPENEEVVPVQLAGKKLYPVTGTKNYSLKIEQDGYLSTIIDSVNIKQLKPSETLSVGAVTTKFARLFPISANLTKVRMDYPYSIENIYYDYNKASLRPESHRSLDSLMKLLLANPEMMIQIGSYCDSRGNDAYNLELSRKRAQSAVDYLISRGIAAERLRSRGFGETRLVNRCTNNVECTEEEHQQNRRTDFQIVKTGNLR